MRSKLTPGPWAIYNTSGKILIETVKHTIDEPRVYIAMQEDSTEADCRLIAAAPEMLATLEHTIDVLFAQGIAPCLQEEIEELIKKVKGE
jgi:hypothetical protein